MSCAQANWYNSWRLHSNHLQWHLKCPWLPVQQAGEGSVFTLLAPDVNLSQCDDFFTAARTWQIQTVSTVNHSLLSLPGPLPAPFLLCQLCHSSFCMSTVKNQWWLVCPTVFNQCSQQGIFIKQQIWTIRMLLYIRKGLKIQAQLWNTQILNYNYYFSFLYRNVMQIFFALKILKAWPRLIKCRPFRNTA